MNMQSFFLGCCAVAVSLSIFGLAGATTVENEIHVKASTGGNQADSVREGTSETEVFIETVVDGQVVEHVEEKKVEKSGNPVEIEVHTYVEPEEQAVEKTEQLEDLESVEESEATQNESKSFFAAVVEFFRGILDKLSFA
jgi:hypothetical protein